MSSALQASFDYVVVGGGSAGCVVAARLSELPTNRVLLIEAGPSDWNPLIHMPTGEALLIGGSLDWRFKSQPEPELGGYEVPLPRGRVLGGSSSINGQVYVRGNKADFDEWQQLGCDGWGWKEVAPLFGRSESWKGPPGELRGRDGPIQVAFGRYRHTLGEAFLDAGRQAGYRFNDDYNGAEQEGFTRTQYTHTHRWPMRSSAARAYLWRARRRSNLTIWTNTRAVKIHTAGKRATGVEVDRRCERIRVAADCEVILSAGAYHSPQLLMISGIGDPGLLAEHGIPCVHEIVGVGRNLQDHAGSCVQHRCRLPETYHNMRNPLKLAVAIAQYAVSGGGPLSVFPMTTMAFLKSHPDVDRPDIQIHLFPAAVTPNGSRELIARYHGYNIHWCVLRPESRGQVRLRTDNPFDAPIIEPRYLSVEQDRVLNRRAFRLARELHMQPAFDRFRGEETDPGASCKSDSEIDSFMARIITSHYHPVGTCKMGQDDQSVVDPRLRVHGMECLRVIDASIMPKLVSGNTNAATVMIGEKGAELILSGQQR